MFSRRDQRMNRRGLGGAPGAGFIPSAIFGSALRLWLRADLGVTLGTTLLASGTTPPIVNISGGAVSTISFRVEITLLGIVGVAQFRYSADGGATWIQSSQVTSGAFVCIGAAAGITIAFQAGTYAADNVYLGTVSTWNDQSGNGYHATQGTASAQPTVAINFKNNVPALSFSAAASQLMNGTAANLITGDWSLFIVGSKVNDPDVDNSGNDKWFGFVGTYGHRAQCVRVAGTRYVCTSVDNTLSNTAFGIGASPAYMSWACVNSGVPQVKCNGVSLATVGVRGATSGITGYQIAGTNAAFLDGAISEIIALNTAASAAQIAAWQAYTRRFWAFP